jgi:hypothetical protein
MDRAKQGNGLLVVAGALFAIGSFLDWATAGPFGVTGMDLETNILDLNDGIFTLLGGLVLLVIGVVAIQGSSLSVPQWAGWAAWAVASVIGLVRLLDILGEESVGLSLGIGMYLVIAGIVLGLVGLVFTRSASDSGDMAPPPPPMG